VSPRRARGEHKEGTEVLCKLPVTDLKSMIQPKGVINKARIDLTWAKKGTAAVAGT